MLVVSEATDSIRKGERLEAGRFNISLYMLCLL